MKITDNAPTMPTTSHTKKRLIVSCNNLTIEQLTLLRTLYPQGFEGALVRVRGMKNEEFNAIIMETDTVQYLVKMETGNMSALLDDDANYPFDDEVVEKDIIPDMENGTDDDTDDFTDDAPDDPQDGELDEEDEN